MQNSVDSDRNSTKNKDAMPNAASSNFLAKSTPKSSKNIQSGKKLSPLAQPSMILDRVYVSSKTAAYHQNTIENLKITHIISIHEDAKPAFEISLGVEYLIFTDIDDKPEESEKLRNVIEITNEFLHDALTRNSENKVLVHCNAGASRSVTVLAFYLMTIGAFGEDSESVLFEIKKKRFQACPNPGFRKILADYENSESLRRERKKLDLRKFENL